MCDVIKDETQAGTVNIQVHSDSNINDCLWNSCFVVDKNKEYLAIRPIRTKSTPASNNYKLSKQQTDVIYELPYSA